VSELDTDTNYIITIIYNIESILLKNIFRFLKILTRFVKRWTLSLTQPHTTGSMR